MIKTAIIGASGYIGHHLLNTYREEFPDTLGTTFSQNVSDLNQFDIRKGDIENLALHKTGHKAAIIAFAKSNISFCEREPSKAYDVNVEGTLNLIHKLTEMSINIIFLSSDYVFDGIKGDFNDEDVSKPSTVYGQHKKIVENELHSLGTEHTVIRLSKVYGLQKGDNTILDEGANLLNTDKQILAATDQYFCPTYIGDVVKAIIAIQESDLRGTINLCSNEKWSRFEIFSMMARKMKKEDVLVKAINLHEINELKGRPLDTSMICSRLNKGVNLKFKPLEDAISEVAHNYKNKNL